MKHRDINKRLSLPQVLLKAFLTSEPIVLCGNCFKTSDREISQTGGSVCPFVDTGWETCDTYYN